MSSHKSRIASIGGVALPPEWTLEGKALREQLDSERLKNPSIDKAVKAAFKKACAITMAQSINGANLVCDKSIREFVVDYNNRTFEHGLDALPSSFNVVEAFVQYIPEYNYFHIREEIDHQFINDTFLDYITSQSNEVELVSLRNLLKEGVIYSYNSIDSPCDFLFESNDECKYGIAGASIIRHGDELSILASFGEHGRVLKTEIEKVSDLESMVRPRGRSRIQPSKDLDLGPVYIDKDSELIRTLALMRVDLNDETVDTRYLFSDLGDRYSLVTDDPSIFFAQFEDKVEPEKILKKMEGELKKKDIVFELCKTLALLPCFFSENDDAIRIDRHSTEYRNFSLKQSNKKITKSIPQQDKIMHRKVEVLDQIDSVHPDYMEFVSPYIRLETRGYYKSLSSEKVGMDKNGNPIRGKTWVEETLKWRESHCTQEIIRASKQRRGGEDASLFNGKIYLIRSEAHAENVFKIGKTDRTVVQRTKEISRGTGVLGSFHPLMQWDVKDSDAAEREIHRRLADYRITKRREFFCAPIEHLRTIIEEVVSEINK